VNIILTSGIGDFIQVYLLLSCCPCEGRISGIVDSPNAVATLAIPTAIFDEVCLQQTNTNFLLLKFIRLVKLIILCIMTYAFCLMLDLSI
jgi:hypothetical protein